MGIDLTNEGTFRGVYDATFDDVRRYCLRRLPVSDVNDAVSEVYLVVWRRLDSVPLEGEALPWIYGVARNVVRRAARTRRRGLRVAAKVSNQAGGTGTDPQERFAGSSVGEDVIEAMSRLSEPDQEVIRLRAWEELTAREMAIVLGCSVSAAEKRTARAFSRLESHFVRNAGTAPSRTAVDEGGSV